MLPFRVPGAEDGEVFVQEEAVDGVVEDIAG